MMSVLMSFLIAIGGASAVDQAMCGEEPVKLHVTRTDRGLVLQVIGASLKPVSVNYRLSVDSEVGNKVSQASRADLQPGDARILSTVLINSTSYSARLAVQCGGHEYVIVQSEPRSS